MTSQLHANEAWEMTVLLILGDKNYEMVAKEYLAGNVVFPQRKCLLAQQDRDECAHML